MNKELKTETLNLRVSLGIKQALRGIAERENRSMVNALECLVTDYYKRNKIELPKPTKESRSAHANMSGQEQDEEKSEFSGFW